MSTTTTQTAIVQSPGLLGSESLPLVVSKTVAVPALPTEHHVLVRVLAVALNPTDYKNSLHFSTPGQGVGSDFCGTVEERGADVDELELGARVCGAVFPYSTHIEEGKPEDNIQSGAFAEWVVADARLLVRVPNGWDDLHGAALGGVGWGTAGLALSDTEALALEGLPSKPVTTKEAVLVYGAATATGTMACQLLSLSGYTPIAITSTQSAALAAEYGAAATAPYTSPTCVATVRSLAGSPIRRVLDCITTPDSVAICFAAIARTGGKYACLEAINESWRTRQLIRVKEVMGYEGLGVPARLGSSPSTYSRAANPSLYAVCRRWRDEVQALLDDGTLRHHPMREVRGQWQGIIDGLAVLKSGEVRGQKLVVRLVLQ